MPYDKYGDYRHDAFGHAIDEVNEEIKRLQVIKSEQKTKSKKIKRCNMTEVYLRFNEETERYDCYNALTDEFEKSLTSGNPFMLIPDDEDLEVSGRIEYDSLYGYYWIDSEDFTRQKLENGMKGYV